MVHIRVVVAALAVGLLAGAARAGVYGPDDPLLRLPPFDYQYTSIRSVLDPLRLALVFPATDEPLARVKQLTAELEAKAPKDMTPPERLTLAAYYLRLGRREDADRLLAQVDATGFIGRLLSRKGDLEAKTPDDLSTGDRISLGGCYLRLNRPNDAVRVLSRADQTNALVLAELASAYRAINELDRAIAYERLALDAWPSIEPGWSGAELAWYRRVEGFNLKLLESRRREGLANPANRPPETLDPLFGKPRSPAGDYQAQEQPWKLWDELPPDGYAIVSQLLVWSPGDDRLYWQLGEVLNSVGPVTQAYPVFDELANSRNMSGVREFMGHRKTLMESMSVANALTNAYESGSGKYYRKDCFYLLFAVAPRGLLTSPGLGDAASTAPAAVAEAYVLQEEERQQGAGPPAPGQRRVWWPDWRPIFVGFAGGFILATLAVLQWTEWRKRRHPDATTPRPQGPPSPRTEPVAHDAGTFRADDLSAPDRVEGTP